MNWKALDIEKDMILEFNERSKTDLEKLIASEYFVGAHITRRQPAEYCNVIVIDCKHKDWWYRDLMGFQFFCQIRYNQCLGGRYISEYVGCKLTNTKQIIFRGFDPEDVMMI